MPPAAARPDFAKLLLLAAMCEAQQDAGQAVNAHNRLGQRPAAPHKDAALLGMPAGVSHIPAGAVGVGGALASMTSTVHPQSAQKVRANETLTIGR